MRRKVQELEVPFQGHNSPTKRKATVSTVGQLSLLAPLVWATIGAIHLTTTLVFPTAPQIAIALFALTVSLVVWFRMAEPVFERLGLEQLDLPALLIGIPWAIVSSRQLLPIWNDSAHYALSAHQLFHGTASLGQVMAVSGSQDFVSGDFHGPLYLLLHWPVALVSPEASQFPLAALAAYAPIALLQTLTAVFLFQALRPIFGNLFAASTLAALFVITWTNGLMTGTHREWLVLYSVVLLGLVLRSWPNQTSKSSLLVSFLAVVFFAQAHITLLLLALAIAVTVALVDFKGLGRALVTAPLKVGAVGFGLLFGYLPLGIRLASGRISGVASYDDVAAFAPEAVARFDASRAQTLSAGDLSLPVPPLPLEVLGILLIAVVAAIVLAVSSRERLIRHAATLFLVYAGIMLIAFVGVFDAVVNAIGIESAWFSLSKLLSANPRYWFVAVLGGLLVVALAFRAWLRIGGNASRGSLHRCWTSRRTIGTGGLAVSALAFGLPVALVVLHYGDGSIGELLLPGRSQWPVYGYLLRLESGIMWMIELLVFLLLAALTVRIWSAFRRGFGEGFANSRDGAVVLSAGVAAVLSLVAMGITTSGYGRGTTAEAFEFVAFWTEQISAAEWDENCWLASSSSSTQAFVHLEGRPHYRLNAGWAARLWGPPTSERSMTPEEMPCAIFPSGFIDSSPAEAVWRQIYTEVACDSLGNCMHADLERVQLAEPTLVSVGYAH